MSECSLIPSIILLIEFVGALVLVAYMARAIYSLATVFSIEKARFLVASGAIYGLDFKTAATLIKTLELGTWDQFGMFMAVLALRIVLKDVFRREQEAYKILWKERSIT
jgi:uncharacterized membrane protein